MEVISVIIPVFNSVQYLQQCMDSVVNQTYKNLEIICIDGGSTDGSLEILQNYADKDSRIEIICNQNDGLSQARKDGLVRATGKYISHIDSDDWLDPTMYEKMIYFAEKYDVDAVGCNYYDVKGKTIYPAICLEEELLDNSSENKMIYKKIYDIDKTKNILNWTFWTYLIKKEVIYPYQMSLKEKLVCCEDVVCIWSFLAEAKKIYILNEKLYYYRTRVRTAENRLDPHYLIDVLNGYNILLNNIRENKHREYLENVFKYAFFDITISETLRFFMKESGQFHMFPYEIVPQNSKIVLYGAGLMGKSYYKQIKENSYCDLVLWVDKEYADISDEMYQVSSPDEIENCKFDFILIAARHIKTAESIKEYLIQNKHVKSDKILLKMPKQLSRYI